MSAFKTFFFDSYMDDLIRDLVLNGKKSSAETYSGALKRMRQCFGSQTILLSEVSREWVLDFKAYLMRSALSTNSINTYLSVVRNAYNRALLDFGVENTCYPFESVFLTIEKPHRVVPGMEVLNKMRCARLEDDLEYLSFSRDLFLFSYYAGGMSFRDMALLKKNNLRKGSLHFRRSRSGSEHVVLLTEPMKAILHAHRGLGVYLFPIIQQPDEELYRQYRSGLRKYNIHICKLADLLNIHVSLNTPMTFIKRDSSI
jgi:hypothetical protein